MDVREVKKHIQAKRLNPFYIFTGEEVEAQRLYINKMAEVTQRTVARAESVAEVLKHRTGVLKIPRLFVVHDDKDFMQTADAWESIEEALGDKVLILQLTTADKRTKFYKHFVDDIVTFNHMDAEVLSKYARKECPMSEENILTLIACCSTDYGNLILEADKIKRFAESQGVGLDTAFTQLLADGVIHRPPEGAVFEFAKAVLQAKPNKAYRLLDECRSTGSSTFGILSALYYSVKQTLQVQSCESKDVTGTTGLSAWEVKRARESVGYWNTADLVDMLKSLQWAEQAIKTGQIEEPLAVDYILTQIF